MEESNDKIGFKNVFIRVHWEKIMYKCNCVVKVDTASLSDVLGMFIYCVLA